MKPRDSDEFESFLRQRSVLSHRLSDPVEPPAELDEIVLNHARRAIQAPQPLPRYRAPRWAFPVGLAAMLLLTLSVAINIGLNLRHYPGTFEARVQTAPAPQSQATAPPSPSPQALAREGGATAQSAPEATVTGARERANAADATAAGARERTNADQAAPPTEVSSAKRSPLSDASSARRSQASRGDPTSWLQHIRKLREAGRDSEADAELRRFEAAFPGYPTTASQPRPAQVPK